jgi:hypothetical protein
VPGSFFLVSAFGVPTIHLKLRRRTMDVVWKVFEESG